MTTIDKEIQKQDPGSALIQLYEIQYSGTSIARFFAGLDDELNPVQFRDSNGTAQTYHAIPMTAQGFDVSTDGAYSRPELSIGNVGNVLSNAIGGLDVETLTGKRLTKRTTLEKYLVGNVGDTNPSTEFPKSVYIIDRIKERNILAVTFELAAPFDLAGVSLPKRNLIGGACPFKYKGGSPSLPIQDRVGGCKWRNKSAPFHDTGSSVDMVDVYMNRYDEYIVGPSVSFATLSGTATAGAYYQTAVTLTQVESTGVKSSRSTFNYWQALAATSATPSDTHTSWRRVRKYTTYNAASTYYAYTDKKHNEYVKEGTQLWQVNATNQLANNHANRIEGNNWTEGDVCGKKINSCKLRFHAKAHPSVSGAVAIETLKEIPLPFGGFPGARQRR